MIANQVAISMQNGRMYEALEEQATTDGLTGLVNHRTFQERFSAMLGRAERHEFAGVAAADRHRPLQEDQRQLRPPHRRRGAAAGGGDPQGQRPQDRHRRPLRRRGVRHRAGGDRPRRAPASWRSASARRSSSRASRRRRAPFKATLSLGVAVYPDDAPRQSRASSRAPTSPSTPPSTAAATAPSASATSTAPV